MRIHELKQKLEPLQGRRIAKIEDDERQAAMDETMKVINGWRLARVETGTVKVGKRTMNVHLVFADEAAMPEFRISIRAGDVHKIERWSPGWLGILFKRGHWSKLRFMGS